jgi:uncharacterized membrane protein
MSTKATQTLSGNYVVVDPGKMVDTPLFPKRDREREEKIAFLFAISILVVAVLLAIGIERFSP